MEALIELIQTSYDARGRQDMTKLPHGGLDPRWFTDDAEFDLGRLSLPDERVWHGLGEIIAGWERWMAQWDEYHVKLSALEAHGPDRIVMDVHAEMQGRGSGAPITVDHCQIWTFRGGLVRRIAVYADRAEAFGQEP